MGTIGGPTNVEPVFSFLPSTRKRLCHDCFNSFSDSVLQVLRIYYFSVHTVFLSTPRKKIKEKNQESGLL